MELQDDQFNAFEPEPTLVSSDTNFHVLKNLLAKAYRKYETLKVNKQLIFVSLSITRR